MTSHSTQNNWLLYTSMILAFCSLLCFVLAGEIGGIIVWLCIASVFLLLLMPHIPRQRQTETRQKQQRHRTYFGNKTRTIIK